MRFSKLLPTAPYLKFIAIALVMMFVFDQFVFGGKRSYLDKIKSNYYAEKAEESRIIQAQLPPKVVFPDEGEYFEAPSEGELDTVVEMTVEEILPNDPTAQEKLAGAELAGIEIVEEEKEETTVATVNTNDDMGTVMEQSFLIDEFSDSAGFKIPQPDALAGKPITKKVVKAEDLEKAKPSILLKPKAKPAPPIKKIAKALPNGQRAQIAIVIDDMGMNISQSKSALKLPSEVTLAFLPYADSARELSKQAQNKGHETIVHIPMEAMDSGINLGAMALRSGMSKEEFTQEFDKIAGSFEGYVGMNNHMGSRLTQDRQAMGIFMAELKKRNLYFLDSKTIHTSVADDVAGAYGVPHVQRDVFLDHDESSAGVKASLKKLEQQALENGQAVAIGHPKAITMKELKAWIPTLEAKGIDLVPVSRLARNEVKKFTPTTTLSQKASQTIVAPDPIVIGENGEVQQNQVKLNGTSPAAGINTSGFSIERVESNLQPLE